MRERLGSLLDRINPIYVERFRRNVEIPVVEEGQPSVYIQLEERGDASRQRLDIWVQPYGQRLRTYRGGGWDIMVGDDWFPPQVKNDPYKKLYKGRDYDPLTEARGWREVMDTVLKLRPIQRATMQGQVLNSESGQAPLTQT